MNITIRIKSVYGKDLIYPVCTKAKAFCELLGQTTLTPDNIKHIKDLGFEVLIQPNELKL